MVRPTRVTTVQEIPIPFAVTITVVTFATAVLHMLSMSFLMLSEGK